MIKRLLPAFCLSLVLAFSSCIADEPLNSECDILGVDSLWLKEHAHLFQGNPSVKNNKIVFWIKEDTDRSALAPKFYITEGSVLVYKQADGAEVPGNGITLDFNQPQTYTVLAQDGIWRKDYKVMFAYPSALKELHFEDVALEDGNERFNVWYEMDSYDKENPRRDYWSTGNPGYALCGLPKQVSDYPTVSVNDGVVGKGVKLVTRTTGNFGMMTRPRMPIAAGSLFIGEFKTQKATTKPLEATTFGQALVSSKPLRLEGYYKFTAGEVFTDRNGNTVEGAVDTCDIYSVVFEIDPDNFVPLDGNDILSSERIVLMSRIDDPGYPEEWTFFNEDYKPMNGKVFDQNKADNGEYAITVVATSSRQGAFFKGAVGSTLYIDELRIVWEDE